MKNRDEESPIPMVCQEEQNLRVALDSARQQADRLISQAQGLAAQHVAEAKRSLPELMHEAGSERRKQIADEARSIRADCQEQASALHAAARTNLSAAVTLIVSLVAPEDNK